MASVKLVLRQQQTDKAGHSPLYLRVIKDRKTKFITTGVKLLPTEWDEAKQKIKKNHPNSARMNAFLAQQIADAEGQVADLERRKKSVSAKKLKEAIKGKDSSNFFTYAYDRCEKIKGTLSLRTYMNYKRYTEKFEKFVGTKDLTFDDITVTMLKDYVNYCSTTLNNGNTTVRYSIMILAIMFKEAIREEIIPANVYPFLSIKLRKDKGKRIYLNADQLQRFQDLKITSEGKAELSRDMFVFSVFGGGLRFGDVMELQWKHFDGENKKINKTIRKTGRQHSFKLGETALCILRKYKTPLSKPDDLVFPLIADKERYFADVRYQYTETERNGHIANWHLRAIGKAIALPFNLSFHLSRHTFATNALNNGMRIEHVSKLLDHTDIGITQIYAKIISEELDKAVDQYIK
ncbi:MAG: site-specific integrase [Bacteroidetes bacterium]|nr:site-specific integrase [Bacteroidota bacterium]